MIKAIIKIDNLYYAGEDTSQVVQADFGGSGWHVANNGGVHPVRLVCDTKNAQTVIGNRNLRSALDIIMRRAEMKMLDFETITIEKVKK